MDGEVDSGFCWRCGVNFLENASMEVVGQLEND
jgi:hypothetical protein